MLKIISLLKMLSTLKNRQKRWKYSQFSLREMLKNFNRTKLTRKKRRNHLK